MISGLVIVLSIHRTFDTRFFLTHFLADTEDIKLKTRPKMIELQREMAIVPTIVLHEVCKFMNDNAGKGGGSTSC